MRFTEVLNNVNNKLKACDTIDSWCFLRKLT